MDSLAEEKEVTKQSKVTFESSAGGKIIVSDDNSNVYEVTSDDAEPLELTVETGTILHLELKADSDYEVSKYEALNENGNIKESVDDMNELNIGISYKKDIAITEDVSIKASFSKPEQEETENNQQGKEYKVLSESSEQQMFTDAGQDKEDEGGSQGREWITGEDLGTAVIGNPDGIFQISG